MGRDENHDSFLDYRTSRRVIGNRAGVDLATNHAVRETSECQSLWRFAVSNLIETGKRWTVQDRYGNQIYLSHERWQHIIEPFNHPDMEGYEEYLRSTIQAGRRIQDSLIPNKYYYRKEFADLPNGNNHIIAVVVFKLFVDRRGKSIPNNFIITAYQNFIYN